LPWLKKWRADVILGKPLFRSAADTDGILGDAIPMPSDARQGAPEFFGKASARWLS